MNRIPPNDIDLEKAVLGAALVNDAAIQHHLAPSDFYHSKHGLVQKAILALESEHDPVNIETVVHRLKGEGLLEQAGGGGYVVSLTSLDTGPSQAEHLAGKILRLSQKRSILHAAQHLQDQCYSLLSEPDELLGVFDTAISSHTSQGHATFLKDDILDTMNELEDIYMGKVEPGVACGYYDLDDKMPLSGGDLTVIAGRPGMGKTALGLGMAKNMAKEGKTVLFFSLEMKRRQVHRRLLSSESRINGKKFRHARFDEKDFANLSGAVGTLVKRKLLIDERAGLSSSQIAAEAMRVKRKHGLDAVFVDHIHLMQDPGKTMHEKVGNAALGLAAASKKLDIPFIAMAQLNRGVDSRAILIPTLSDLRESGTIEEIAAQVAFIYRQDYYVEQGLIDPQDRKKTNPYKESREGKGLIVVAKNRHGENGVIELLWNGPLTQYENLEYRHD